MIPDRIEIGGRWYIAEDAMPQPSVTPTEMPMRLVDLCAEYDVDVHRANRAAQSGALNAKPPNGCAKPRMCMRTEFIRWLTEPLTSGRA